MSITDREELVLNAIVNYYLTFGDTIGSRTLVKKYGIDLSSATIRNVMADLEDMGFIAKTHTSSGRIPTDKGYKYYLEELLKVEKLTKQERENIELAYENRVNELDTILQQTSTLLSKLTTYAGIAMEPAIIIERIRKVELVHIDDFMLVVIIVLDNRSVKTKKLVLTSPISREELANIAFELNKRVLLEDLSLVDIENYILGKKERIANIADHYEDDSKLFINNVPSIFKDKHVNEVSEALELFHHRKDIREIFEHIINTKKSINGRVEVVFGDELGIKGLEDYSFVYSTYNIGDSQGVIGVIGPKRMAYSKTMGFIKYVTQEVNKIINKNQIERKEEIDV
ncbi:heat-inducible transcriptional repressor HrcA [Fusobacterium sp.]|uniref:heat-inducible transcriptional repressor HrcA n=1 Tax=Fusobacterium sp. TaxID=68766 RepID=UPI0025C4C296|nr:heat-inducible transcriptional repressor HrcA [Fusobacterium sp.]